jgi:hypothetical protein
MQHEDEEVDTLVSREVVQPMLKVASLWEVFERFFLRRVET